MFLKVVSYPNGVRTGESLYEGERLHVRLHDSENRWSATVESATGAVSVEIAPHCVYFVMNDAGDTIDSFCGDRYAGSPERSARITAAAAAAARDLMPDAI